MFNWFKNNSPQIQKVENPDANCPNCSEILQKFPSRKSKCPFCKKDIYVRTHYLNNKKILLTEKESEKYDLEKDEYYVNKNLLDSLKNCEGISVQYIDRLVKSTEEELSKKFNMPALFGDVVWGASNKILMEELSKGNMNNVFTIYWGQAMLLHLTGKDSSSIKQILSDNELRNYKKMDIKKISISTAKDCSCDACKELEGKVFDLNVAIKEHILPCKECTYKMNPKTAKFGWCRCVYTAEFED